MELQESVNQGQGNRSELIDFPSTISIFIHLHTSASVKGLQEARYGFHLEWQKNKSSLFYHSI